jgi:hypothetical protein
MMMNTNAALKIAQPVHSIAQSRAEIFELFNANSSAGLLWDNLPEPARNLFCRAAGLKQQHIRLPLNEFHELDRLKLFKAIKSTEQIIQQFASLSFKDFK